jgi:hypothetical protein
MQLAETQNRTISLWWSSNEFGCGKVGSHNVQNEILSNGTSHNSKCFCNSWYNRRFGIYNVGKVEIHIYIEFRTRNTSCGTRTICTGVAVDDNGIGALDGASDSAIAGATDGASVAATGAIVGAIVGAAVAGAGVVDPITGAVVGDSVTGATVGDSVTGATFGAAAGDSVTGATAGATVGADVGDSVSMGSAGAMVGSTVGAKVGASVAVSIDMYRIHKRENLNELKNDSQPEDLQLPSCNVYLVSNGTLVSSIERRTLLWKWAEFNIQRYYEEKLGVTTQELHYINWAGRKIARGRLPGNIHMFSQKYGIGWLATGSRMERMGKQVVGCPLCKEDEDNDHLLTHAWKSNTA